MIGTYYRGRRIVSKDMAYPDVYQLEDGIRVRLEEIYNEQRNLAQQANQYMQGAPQSQGHYGGHQLASLAGQRAMTAQEIMRGCPVSIPKPEYTDDDILVLL